MRSGTSFFHNAQALCCCAWRPPHELARFFPPLFLDEVLEHSSPFIDRVVTINGRQLLINTFPLAMSSSTTGAVCFIHDVQNLQKINRKIDTDLHSRGLVANYTARDIIGKSASVVKLKENIARYAPTDISVYIHGETGTGKGACRTRPARRQQTGQAAFCGGQLRGPAGPAAGKRTVRL